jgi:PhnB protein
MYVPPGFTRVFPYIFAKDAHAYLDFLRDGLGGEIVGVQTSPEGLVRNAHVRFGDTTIMVSEATETREASRGTHYLYVSNADEAVARAVSRGAAQLGMVTDMAYGDRQAGVVDPAGNTWWISQRLGPGPYA